MKSEHSQASNESLYLRPFRIKRLSSINEECTGRVTDVSERHVQFTLDQNFRVGEILKAVVNERALFGVVRSCEGRDCHYKAEVDVLFSITKAEIDALLREWGLRPSPFCYGA
jgi:hypothetical protein